MEEARETALTRMRWNPKALDQKWQRRWHETGMHTVSDDDSRQNWYELTMYPYPSGDVHIGHWYAMAPSDTHARFRRMQGYNVLHPMGFDAFGLPAENAAINRGIHPHTWTMQNIERMRGQLRSMGTIYDWDREVVCCSPEYYRWNQWLFLQLYKAGLAYRSRAPAVWCTSCQTVLANEQVVNGNCERCATPITRRELKQWFLGITRYAEELLDFSGLIEWPEKILSMQRNWIGRSEGAEVGFDISHLGLSEQEIRVFTTRVDTLYGVTFLVLAPEHPLVSKITVGEQRHAIEEYVGEARRKSDIERLSADREKTGVHTGAYCLNRITGEWIPILIADYAVAWYAQGAVMGVPAHDQRDFEFAKKYSLPVRVVVSPPDWDGGALDEAYTGDGLQVNSDQFNGIRNEFARESITRYLQDKQWGRPSVTYRLRDWLISRQRYWGTPIPIIHCESCGIVPVPDTDLPVLLPEDAEFKLLGESPLARNREFLSVECPKCGKPASRETDTMDTFFDSSWYFLRYLSPHEHERPWDPGAVKKWMAVDQYTGGAEHAIMHLLYSRFFTKALRDLGLLEFGEPFLRLFNQGHIVSQGAKMSKSRGNVVSPDSYVSVLGADVVRLYLMFVGPWDRGGEWQDSGVNGIARWLNRLWDLLQKEPAQLVGANLNRQEQDHLSKRLHQTIRKVKVDLETFNFNTAIAALMEFSNDLGRVWKAKAIDTDLWREIRRAFVLMLAPLAPHIAEELWERIGEKFSVHNQRLPDWDENRATDEMVTLVVQVDGKVRDKLTVGAKIGEDEAVMHAMSSATVLRHLAGRRVGRTVYVSGRLINIVTDPIH